MLTACHKCCNCTGGLLEVGGATGQVGGSVGFRTGDIGHVESKIRGRGSDFPGVNESFIGSKGIKDGVCWEMAD